MLRHFVNVTPEISAQLLKEGYTKKEVDNELSLVGSKFNEQFTTNITSLLNRFIQYPLKEEIGENGNLIIECNVPNIDFPKGIGSKAVISIQDIPENERKFIFLKKNREIDLLHYKVDQFPITNTCTLILKPIKNGYLFISSFPGEPAMPIPVTSMDLSLYTTCKKFWDSHVFLLK